MLRVAPEVLDLLNNLIRHEDREDHASVLADLVTGLGGEAATRQGDGTSITSMYEHALTGDLPPIVLDALRRNLEAKRR